MFAVLRKVVFRFLLVLWRCSVPIYASYQMLFINVIQSGFSFYKGMLTKKWRHALDENHIFVPRRICITRRHALILAVLPIPNGNNLFSKIHSVSAGV